MLVLKLKEKMPYFIFISIFVMYLQMSSVIHANQQSVIQTATPTVQSSLMPKSNVILLGAKLPSVIQAPHGTIQPLQVCMNSLHRYRCFLFFKLARK